MAASNSNGGVQALVSSQNQERARLRVVKACDRCRAHKIKCTGTFPCNNCTKHNIACNFRTGNIIEEPQPGTSRPEEIKREPTPLGAKRQRRENSTPLQDYESQALPILPKDLGGERYSAEYTQHLESRVQYLETLLLENLSLTFRNVGTINPDVDDVNDLMAGTLSKWRFLRRHQTALVNELCKSLFEGLSAENKSKVDMPRTQYFGWNMSGCNYLKPEKLPEMPDLTKDLLEDTQKYYIDFFFEEINPLFAIIHESVFREQLVYFQDMLAAQDVPNGNSTALFSAMLCLVFVLSIRFTEFRKPNGPSMQQLHLEERLFQYSHKVLLILSFEWESFELIQCWLLVTLYLRTAYRQTSSNFAMGHAVTMFRSMGLGRTSTVMADVTTYENLKAKRIFLAVYCFDRIIGLQGGRCRAINEFDITRKFPSFNYEEEKAKDDWITRPAFAMMQIARVANFIHTSTSDNYDLIKSQQINKELSILGHWLDRNGFDDVTDIYPAEKVDGAESNGSELLKAQVKLHYYDLQVTVHGKSLFNYLGKRVATEGMKVEKIVDANEGIIYLVEKIDANGDLYVPWYPVLLLIFNVAINCLVFINAGVFIRQSRWLLQRCVQLLTKLQDSPVRDDRNRLVYRERFKMVSECIWAIKIINHSMELNFEESLKSIRELGTDHGPSDVNRLYFSQFGLMKDKNKQGIEKLMEDHLKRGPKPKASKAEVEATHGPATDVSSESFMSQPASTGFGGEELFDNLAWFDKWLHFNNGEQ